VWCLVGCELMRRSTGSGPLRVDGGGGRILLMTVVTVLMSGSDAFSDQLIQQAAIDLRRRPTTSSSCVIMDETTVVFDFVMFSEVVQMEFGVECMTAEEEATEGE